MNIKDINNKSGLNQMFISLVPFYSCDLEVRSYVKKVNFTPKKRLCCLQFEHLFIVILYKTCICHSLEILFEPPHLLLGERTMGRSKEVNFQYKNIGGRGRREGGVLEMFLKFKVFLVSKRAFLIPCTFSQEGGY